MNKIIILILCLFYFFQLNNANPVLYEKYSWATENNINYSIVLTGTGFSFISDNIVFINYTNSYNCGFANDSSIQGYGQIFCPLATTSSIVGGSPFTVFVKCFGETSNVVSWYLINPISIYPAIYPTLGGPVALRGVFTTSNISMINLTIGGTPCKIQSMELLFEPQYRIILISPYKPAPGLYEIKIEIGGLEFKSNVKYADSGSPSLMSKYSWSTLPSNNKTVLTFYGYDFTIYSYNTITINGVPYNATAVKVEQYNEITLLDDSATKSLNEGDLFYVNAIVAGQTLYNDVVFFLVKSISITKIDVFQSIGGVTTIEGEFGPGGVFPTLSIGDTLIFYFQDYSSSILKFQYPVKSAGTYNLVLNWGGLQIEKTVTYVTSPAPSLLNKYKSSGNKLVFTGKWFGYFSVNYVTINNESTIAVGHQNIAASPLLGYDCISVVDFPSLSIGDKFTVALQVEGQSSNIMNLVYLQSISMITKTLNTTGGIVEFLGSFTVSNKNIVTLSINDVSCQVISITPSLIKFRYPPMVEYQYTLLIDIGGFEYSTSIQYDAPPSPTILNNYKWSLNKLIFTGTSFSYVNQNYLIINGENYTATPAVGSEIPGHDEITFEILSVSSLLQQDQQFTVQVLTGGLYSNIVTFNYIEKISMIVHNIYNIGGVGSEYVTINGVYSTSNASIISLYIGKVKCNVYSIEPTKSIKFSYNLIPVKESSELELTIGGLLYKTTINVIQTPKPILFNSYNWSSQDNSILVLKGTTFNYKSTNDININGKNYSSTTAILNDNGNDEITPIYNSSTSLLSIGDAFTVFINNGFENSNSVTFLFIKSISVTTKSLNNTGGLVTFSGDYNVSNKTFVSLLIDGSIVQVTEISKTFITFNYPAKSVGQYNLLINIGGFEYSTNVVYISQVSPSTTGTQTTASSSTDDTPSVSSNLTNSFFLKTLTFLLCFLFLN